MAVVAVDSVAAVGTLVAGTTKAKFARQSSS
jgi:hypothetical protein